MQVSGRTTESVEWLSRNVATPTQPATDGLGS